MPLSKPQAQAIAHLVHQLRPEWSERGIMAQLGKLTTRRATDVALASIRAAADPEAKTPGVIPTPGSHWDEGVQYEASRLPKRDEECHIHPGSWRGNCHGCAADRLARTESPRRTGERVNGKAAEARALLRSALANCCPCGIPPNLCNVHRPDTAEESA